MFIKKRGKKKEKKEAKPPTGGMYDCIVYNCTFIKHVFFLGQCTVCPSELVSRVLELDFLEESKTLNP